MTATGCAAPERTRRLRGKHKPPNIWLKNPTGNSEGVKYPYAMHSQILLCSGLLEVLYPSHHGPRLRVPECVCSLFVARCSPLVAIFSFDSLSSFPYALLYPIFYLLSYLLSSLYISIQLVKPPSITLIMAPPKISSPTTADYIVIGGGTAGLVVASRLTEDPNVHVLVLEAGLNRADDPRINIPAFWTTLMGSEADWQFKTLPQVSMQSSPT